MTIGWVGRKTGCGEDGVEDVDKVDIGIRSKESSAEAGERTGTAVCGDKIAGEVSVEEKPK